MRSLALPLGLLALAGCVVYETRPYRPPPPGSAVAPPPAPAPARYMGEQEAVDAGFQIARARGLAVDRVQRAHLDGEGRWHLDLRGHGDRAQLLLDARDGHLLRGKFKERGRGDDEDWRD
jgi:hypothetical protein